MENQIQINNQILNDQKRFQRVRLILYSEDFDFAQSFSLYFRKDYHKIVTVNDRDILLQIVSSLQPDFIILDEIVNESLLYFVNEIRKRVLKSRIFVFTSHAVSQQEIVKRLSRLVDRIIYQPIDLSEFHQLMNFYSAD